MAHASFTIEVMIRGYHIYRDIWSAVLDELLCERESDNFTESAQFFTAVLASLIEARVAEAGPHGLRPSLIGFRYW